MAEIEITTEATLYETLGERIRQYATICRKIETLGFRHGLQDQKNWLFHDIQEKTYDLFPTYDEATRARMIAFAVAVMG